MKHRAYEIPLAFLVLLAFAAPVRPQPQAVHPLTDGSQMSIDFLGNSASLESKIFEGINGVANGDPDLGDSFWYFSLKRTKRDELAGRRKTSFLRVSYDHYLDYSWAKTDNGKKRYLVTWVRDVLPGISCVHVGDIDYHVYKGQGFIVAPYDDCSGGDSHSETGVIAFFRATDLAMNDTTIVPVASMETYHPDFQREGAPWVAVHPKTGAVYSSSGKSESADHVFRYSMSWEAIREAASDSDPAVRILETPTPTRIPTLTESGTPLRLRRRQGADFSTDGRGFFMTFGTTDNPRSLTAFLVEDAQDGSSDEVLRRFRDSSRSQGSVFRYQVEGTAQEPEGVSYFDTAVLDPAIFNYRMPRGELHVMLVSYTGIEKRTLYLKHYTSRIYAEDFSETRSGLDDLIRDAWSGQGIFHGATLLLPGGPLSQPQGMLLRAADLVAPDYLATTKHLQIAAASDDPVHIVASNEKR